MNKRFECRSCDRQCAAECEETPKVCLRALIAEPDAAFPLWFPVGGSSAAKAPEDKPEADKAPEWCRVGNWCFQSRDDGDGKTGFGRIVEVGGAAMRVKYLTGRMEAVDFASGRLMSFQPAQVRPWTFEEAPEAIKVTLYEGGDPKPFYDVLRLEATGGLDDPATFYSDRNGCHITETDLMNRCYRYSLLDGAPCGMLVTESGIECNPA